MPLRQSLRETHRLTLSRSAFEPFAFVSLCHPAQCRITTDGLCGSLKDLGVAVEMRVGEPRQLCTLYFSQRAVS
jgi:hypothetical protein